MFQLETPLPPVLWSGMLAAIQVGCYPIYPGNWVVSSSLTYSVFLTPTLANSFPSPQDILCGSTLETKFRHL